MSSLAPEKQADLARACKELWQTMNKEFPVFIRHPDQTLTGPYLNRDTHMLAIPDRVAWALIRKGSTFVLPSGEEIPANLPTYGPAVTTEIIRAQSSIWSYA